MCSEQSVSYRKGGAWDTRFPSRRVSASVTQNRLRPLSEVRFALLVTPALPPPIVTHSTGARSP
jgi:hypothetical protein